MQLRRVFARAQERRLWKAPSTKKLRTHPGCCHATPSCGAWRHPFQGPCLPFRVLTWLLELLYLAGVCSGEDTERFAFVLVRTAFYAFRLTKPAPFPFSYSLSVRYVLIRQISAGQSEMLICKPNKERQQLGFDIARKSSSHVEITSQPQDSWAKLQNTFCIAFPQKFEQSFAYRRNLFCCNLLYQPWLAPSRPPASPPEARRPASSWPPRPLASPHPPPEASRSLTGLFGHFCTAFIIVSVPVLPRIAGTLLRM